MALRVLIVEVAARCSAPRCPRPGRRLRRPAICHIGRPLTSISTSPARPGWRRRRRRGRARPAASVGEALLPTPTESMASSGSCQGCRAIRPRPVASSRTATQCAAARGAGEQPHRRHRAYAGHAGDGGFDQPVVDGAAERPAEAVRPARAERPEVEPDHLRDHLEHGVALLRVDQLDRGGDAHRHIFGRDHVELGRQRPTLVEPGMDGLEHRPVGARRRLGGAGPGRNHHHRDDARNVGAALLRLEPFHHLDPADGDAGRAVGELLDVAPGDAAAAMAQDRGNPRLGLLEPLGVDAAGHGQRLRDLEPWRGRRRGDRLQRSGRQRCRRCRRRRACRRRGRRGRGRGRRRVRRCRSGSVPASLSRL